MNPSTLEKMHLMADGLCQNGVSVKTFWLCHTEKTKSDFILYFGQRQRYSQHMGPVGTKYEGKHKISRAFNQLKLSIILFWNLFLECFQKKVKAVIIPRNYLLIIVPLILLKKVFRFDLIANIMEYSPCLPGFDNSFELKRSWKLILRYSDKFIVISHFLQKKVKVYGASFYLPALLDVGTVCGKSKKKIVVDTTIQSFNSLHKGSGTRHLLLYTCSSSYTDLLGFCIEAISLMKCKNFVLVITGSYPHEKKNRFLELIRKKELGDRVFFTGFLPEKELTALQMRSDALLIPLLDTARHKARFPQKIMQYLLLGKPVVSTNIGEMRYNFTHDLNAFLDDTVTPHGYAKAITNALNDGKRYNEVAKNSQSFVVSRFDYLQWGNKLSHFISMDRSTEGRQGKYSV